MRVVARGDAWLRRGMANACIRIDPQPFSSAEALNYVDDGLGMRRHIGCPVVPPVQRFAEVGRPCSLEHEPVLRAPSLDPIVPVADVIQILASASTTFAVSLATCARSFSIQALLGPRRLRVRSVAGWGTASGRDRR